MAPIAPSQLPPSRSVHQSPAIPAAISRLSPPAFFPHQEMRVVDAGVRIIECVERLGRDSVWPLWHTATGRFSSCGSKRPPPSAVRKMAVLTTYCRLLELFDRRERWHFWLLLVLMLAMGLIEMLGVASIFPFLSVLSNQELVHQNNYIKAVYDSLGFKSTQSFLIFLGIICFAFFIFSQFVKSITIYSLIRFGKMRGFTLSTKLLAKYLRQPYVWFLHRNSADLGKSVLSEVDRLVLGLITPSLRFLAYGSVAIFLIVILVLFNPLAAVFGALIVGGLYGLIYSLVRRYLSHIGKSRVKANEQRFRSIQEGLGGIKDIKVLGIEKYYIEQFRQPALAFAKYETNASALGELPRYLLEATIFGGMLLFVFVLLLTSEGKMEQVLPIVGVYAFAGSRMLPALQHIYRSVALMRFNRHSLDVIYDDLQDRPPAEAARASGDPLVLRERLRLSDVTYRYPGADRPALAGLSLDIEAFTTVGIVGASGAGKTTTVDLLLGLLEPDDGRISVDGCEIGAHNRRTWQRSLGYVPQQIFLTDDTIAANIALGVPPNAIDMAAVERAARTAKLHDFVEAELPKKYLTDVGERGVRLSGGQRQRIGIARALYNDPSVLIFDEATSALDNLTERALMDAVHNLAKAKTIIMIAHRLSTVQHCDRIFLLEHGRCTAVGTYDELVQTNHAFRELALPAGV